MHTPRPSRLLDHIPERVAAAPERVLINAACALIGIGTLVSDRTSRLWPAQAGQVWGLVMLAGGLAVLVGYWNVTQRRWAGSLERVGYMAILLASLLYAVRLLMVLGWHGLPVAGVFFGLAGAKGLRLLVTSAARDQVLRGPGRGEGR